MSGKIHPDPFLYVPPLYVERTVSSAWTDSSTRTSNSSIALSQSDLDSMRFSQSSSLRRSTDEETASFYSQFSKPFITSPPPAPISEDNCLRKFLTILPVLGFIWGFCQEVSLKVQIQQDDAHNEYGRVYKLIQIKNTYKVLAAGSFLTTAVTGTAIGFLTDFEIVGYVTGAIFATLSIWPMTRYCHNREIIAKLNEGKIVLNLPQSVR